MKYWPEIATAFFTVLGWLLIVWGLASLLSWQVWPIGVGIGLLSLVGLRFLWTVISIGVYALSKADNESTGGGG